MINGTGYGYEPMRSITRAEFVKLVVEALDCELKPASGDVFNDVQATDWFAPYVECAAESGIVVGDGMGGFKPNAPISRYEIATIMRRLDESVVDDVTLGFSDTDMIPAWAMDGVEYVSAQGIMNGYNNYFDGARDITRAESAVVIYRYLSILK